MPRPASYSRCHKTCPAVGFFDPIWKLGEELNSIPQQRCTMIQWFNFGLDLRRSGPKRRIWISREPNLSKIQPQNPDWIHWIQICQPHQCKIHRNIWIPDAVRGTANMLLYQTPSTYNRPHLRSTRIPFVVRIGTGKWWGQEQTILACQAFVSASENSRNGNAQKGKVWEVDWAGVQAYSCRGSRFTSRFHSRGHSNRAFSLSAFQKHSKGMSQLLWNYMESVECKANSFAFWRRSFKCCPWYI